MQWPDWTDLHAVILFAKAMGPGMVVIQHATRHTYNITHAERKDRWDVDGVTVYYRT